MYSYSYNSDFLDLILKISGGILIGTSVIGILMIVSMWKIFKKAGKAGWEAIIPIYNIIVLLEVSKIEIWQIVLFFIPFANIYIMFKIYIELAKRFGKSSGFGVFIAFFPYIGLPILAFGDSKYESTNDSASSNRASSILDVNESGVPNNSETKEFSYGYEKEETIVMPAVEPSETDNNEDADKNENVTEEKSE